MSLKSGVISQQLVSKQGGLSFNRGSTAELLFLTFLLLFSHKFQVTVILDRYICCETIYIYIYKK